MRPLRSQRKVWFTPVRLYSPPSLNRWLPLSSETLSSTWNRKSYAVSSGMKNGIPIR